MAAASGLFHSVPSRSAVIAYQKETWAKLLPELPALFVMHWQEVGLDREKIPLDPDWERYALLEAQGILHMVTARDDGILIGYYVALVLPHLHYKSSRTAFSDIFFIHPEYRRGLTGYKLFLETEKMLKKLGVQKSYVMTKQHLPLNILMKRLKYRFIEKIYTKLL